MYVVLYAQVFRHILSLPWTCSSLRYKLFTSLCNNRFEGSIAISSYGS